MKKNMQKVITFLMLLFIAISCSKKNEAPLDPEPEIDALDAYYMHWVDRKRVPIQKMDGKFYVEFYTTQEDQVKDECEKAGVTISNIQLVRDYSESVLPTTFGLDAAKFTGLMWAVIEGSNEQCAILLSSMFYWSPFYQLMSGEVLFEVSATSEFLVESLPRTTYEQLEQLAKEHSVEVIGMDSYKSSRYHLACTSLSKGNSLEMANLFYKSGLFKNAFPNWLYHDDFYWSGGQLFPIQKMDGKFYVEFYTTQEDQVKDECEKAGVTISNIQLVRDYSESVLPTTFGLDAAKFTGLMWAVIEGSNEQCAILLSSMFYWSAFYISMDGHDDEMSMTSRLSVEFDPRESTYEQLEQLALLAKEYSVEIIGIDVYNSLYRLACTSLSKGNSLEIAMLFYKTGLFKTAFPNIVASLRFL